jgi:murein endopeptidase
MSSLIAALLLLLSGQPPQPHPEPNSRERAEPRIEWHDSVAFGTPGAGNLQNGVKLPAAGKHYFTWDPIRRSQPNRGWRRWGTDELVRTLLDVIRAYARAHPGASRVGVGDLSRPEGGSFGPEFGGIGHATHQNGLDADVYYPLLDGQERAPLGAGEIDPALSQELVDRFVRAGAATIYVGPNTGLTGPPGVVVPLVNHDNHLHVRIAP